MFKLHKGDNGLFTLASLNAAIKQAASYGSGGMPVSCKVYVFGEWFGVNFRCAVSRTKWFLFAPKAQKAQDRRNWLYEHTWMTGKA